MSAPKAPKPTSSTQRELWRRANGMCQKCACELDPGTRGPAPTAEVAHIKALRDGGARAVPGLSIEERNSIDNLILLCPQCHDLIDKDETTFTSAALLKLKRDHEQRAAGLRESGQVWRMRFASIDYLNLPRIAAMPGTNLMLRAAERTHLDTTRPFREQGAAPGFFIAEIHPLFAIWDARASQLTDATEALVQHGQMVSFEQSMRARNTAHLPRMPEHLTWDNVPQLVCKIGKRRVRIRFDADWITTQTPILDLKGAARQPVVYAGLGQVVGITDAEIRLSARVFGHPQSPGAAMLDYLKSSRESGPRTLIADDFVNEFSVLQRESSSLSREHSGESLKNVVLHFDEDEVIPGQIEREVFSQILRVIPEFRRDVRVSVSSMSLRAFQKSDGMIFPMDVSAALLGERMDLWKKLAIPELATHLQYRNIAMARVESVTIQQADDLHSALREASESYLGAIEVDLDLDAHRRVYTGEMRYRLVQSDLRLLWSELERAISGDGIEEKLAEWEASGLFRYVNWEDGPGVHDAELRELGANVVRWLTEQGNPSPEG